MIKPIPKHKLAFGRKLRNSPTRWEFNLWQHLKNSNLGFRFKRQVYIGRYIVDFCCNQKKLIIEVDGASHRYNPLKDKERLTFLDREGYIVLRFWNGEIDKDIDSVLDKIIKVLK